MDETKAKLTKVRTFADDMKRGQAAQKDASAAADTTPIPAHDTKTDTDTDTAAQPSNSKTPAAAAKPTSDERPSFEKAAAAVSQTSKPKQTTKTEDGAPSSAPEVTTNPPFHTLEKRTGDTSQSPKVDTEALHDTSKRISSHPDSILDSGPKGSLEVGAEETSTATIVTDTKRTRKGLLADITDSVKDWAVHFKNTYITPEQETYTVGRSNRRAGVLQEAAPKTGAAHVGGAAIADRVRSRYQHDTNEATTPTAATTDGELHTDPVFLPSLPAGEDVIATATDVQTKPRKRAVADAAPSKGAEQSTTTAAATETANTSGEPPAAKTAEDAPAINTPSTSPEEPTTPPEQTAASEIPPPSTPRPAPAPDTATTPDADQPAPAADPTAPAESTAETVETTEPTEPEAETQGRPDRARRAADESVLSDEEYEYLESKYQTNTLTIQIVGTCVTLALLIGVGYLVAMLVTDNSASSDEATLVIGEVAYPVVLNNYLSIEARFMAMRDLVENAEEQIVQITPHVRAADDSVTRASADRINDALGLRLPIELRATMQAMHFGQHQQNNPFVYLDIDNEQQSFGALLQWEDRIRDDLQLWFPDARNGTFTDETVAGYDARVLRHADGNAELTYAVVDGYVLITTSPGVFEQVISHRQ